MEFFNVDTLYFMKKQWLELNDVLFFFRGLGTMSNIFILAK